MDTTRSTRKGEPLRAVSWQCDLTNYRRGGFMNFAQSLCVGIFVPLLGGLGALAVGRPDEYLRLFPYIIGVMTFGAIGVVVYEVGHAHGAIAQWRARTSGERGEIVQSPVPTWFRVLEALLYISVALLWLVARVIAPQPLGGIDAGSGHAAAVQHPAGTGEAK